GRGCLMNQKAVLISSLRSAVRSIEIAASSKVPFFRRRSHRAYPNKTSAQAEIKNRIVDALNGETKSQILAKVRNVSASDTPSVISGRRRFGGIRHSISFRD